MDWKLQTDLQAREEIISGDFLFYRVSLHGKSRILKVSLRDRANQFRSFNEPGRDYSIPVSSSIFYELSFFMTAAPKRLI